MKLAAIYNVWDDWDLLDYSVKNIDPLVEGIIIVASEYSNYGEYSPIPEQWRSVIIPYKPQGQSPMNEETTKRNLGLMVARKSGYTHFLTMDADEFYDPKEFEFVKQKRSTWKGSVCPSIVYFGSPTLTIGRDITLVPFIHEISEGLRHGINRNYPYAYINRQIRIDPTRQLSISKGVQYTEEVTMHHYSWVRPDYEKKIRNSTARANLEKSCILNDLRQAKEGYFCEYYKRSLTRVENRFNIPEYGAQTSIRQGS